MSPLIPLEWIFFNAIIKSGAQAKSFSLNLQKICPIWSPTGTKSSGLWVGRSIIIIGGIILTMWTAPVCSTTHHWKHEENCWLERKSFDSLYIAEDPWRKVWLLFQKVSVEGCPGRGLRSCHMTLKPSAGLLPTGPESSERKLKDSIWK